MSKIRNLASQIWDKAFVFCGVLCVMLPTSPLNMQSITRDSGVFLYIGWRILNGELPYRDIWDQKPPVIFYLNALGLAISKHSLWGIWFIECIFLILAAYIGFRLIRKTWGTLPAVFSSLIWLLTLTFLITSGNFTEEYVLLLQFAALLLISNVSKSDFRNWQVFLIGLIGALAFFTKQTTIGIWVAIFVYLTIQRLSTGQVKRWFQESLLLFLGALPIIIGIVLFFGVQGGLAQFWSAAFQYNFIYSSAANITKLKYIAASGITTLAQVHSPIFYFSVVGYVAGLVLIIYKKPVTRKWIPLLAVGLIDLPIELFLVSISGRNYPHYYISLLPILSLFVAIVFWMLISQLSTWGVPKSAKYIFTLGVMGLILWSSFREYHTQVTAYAKAQDETVINHINDYSTPDDYVLLWGAEASVNFLTQRRSPTRFFYQYPLYQAGYTNETIILEFLDGVIKNRPRLLIDTKNILTPMYDFPIQSTAINTDIAYLKSHYFPTENLGTWTVYTYSQDASNP